MKNTLPPKVVASASTFSPLLGRRIYQPPVVRLNAAAALADSLLLPVWIRLLVASYRSLSARTV
ncbi:hypothetical protein D3C78_1417730 [compost metagenome]